MTDDALLRALRSVGMAAFITHLDLFQTGGADALHLRTGWTTTACITRVNKARAILNAGRLTDALALIASADRVTPQARQIARQLLAR